MNSLTVHVGANVYYTNFAITYRKGLGVQLIFGISYGRSN